MMASSSAFVGKRQSLKPASFTPSQYVRAGDHASGCVSTRVHIVPVCASSSVPSGAGGGGGGAAACADADGPGDGGGANPALASLLASFGASGDAAAGEAAAGRTAAVGAPHATRVVASPSSGAIATHGESDVRAS